MYYYSIIQITIHFFHIKVSLLVSGGCDAYIGVKIRKVSLIRFKIRKVSFFYLGFLSRPFTIHRTVVERGGHFFNSSLPLPPASPTLRHSPSDYCRELTSAHSQQPKSNRDPLVSERKLPTTKLNALHVIETGTGTSVIFVLSYNQLQKVWGKLLFVQFCVSNQLPRLNNVENQGAKVASNCVMVCNIVQGEKESFKDNFENSHNILSLIV